ncbi:MAG: N-acetyl-gamma-glutamyl-phosphate reductase, partial [Lachnospiraceae bacterium]|nr:N-acetyl-gamma-glutamyl-phosphate reductase [Lachnospiraceae bacterium]
EGWTYGFPEIRGLREEIRTSKRIANPGCYASGFISLVAPLVEKGIIDKNACLSAFGISGYSGGGKKMIAAYEAEERDPLFEAPRIYALTQSHKHLPEMAKISGLSVLPVFSPIVSSYYSGMEICVPLFAKDIQGTPADIEKIYIDYYNSNLVRYVKEPDENGFLSAVSLSGKDSMQISVTGNSERILLVSRFDNLGKGASGAAIQNMNIAMGIEEETGLIL